MTRDARPLGRLLFLLGDAALTALSTALVYLLISRLRGAELLGQYTVVLSWTAIFQAIGSCGIPEFVIREAGRDPQGEDTQLVHGLVAALATSAAAGCVMFLLAGFAPYGAEVRRSLEVGAATVVPFTLTATCRGGLLVRRRAGLIFLMGLVETVAVVGLNATLVVEGYGIVALLSALLAGKLLATLVGLALLARGVRGFERVFDGGRLRRMLGPIAAFALSNWLSILAKRVNVIALSMTTSLAAVGIYSAANSFAEISFVVTAVVAQLALPQLSRTLATEPREALRHYEGMIRLLFSATLPLAAGAIWFAGPIVSLAFGPEFAGSVPVLRVLMLVFLFDSTDTLMSLLLKAAGRQNQDVRLYAPNPVVNLALNLVLIPWLGPTGSALAKGAGTLSSWLLRARASARLGFGASWLRLARRPAVATVAALAPAVLAGRFVGAPAQLAGYAALSAVLFLRWTGAERADTLTSGAGRSAGGEEGRA